MRRTVTGRDAREESGGTVGRNQTRDYSQVVPVTQSPGAAGNQSAQSTSRKRSVGPAGNSAGVWPRIVTDQIHKMSQPLTALHGTVELALLSERTAEGYRAALEESLEHLIRLNGIVSSLRDLADAHLQSAQPKSPVLRISVSRGPFEEATLAVEVPGQLHPRKKTIRSVSLSAEEGSTTHRRAPKHNPGGDKRAFIMS